ncbi:hypothetical protein [Rhizobium tropici]|uniref:Uncharacterized protein n=1 Tax=Rhizobium tropici TaxID=398 RepID=A0A6P1C9F8_RHITR|nr:hypothetical protein [Rhizobium tropici]NEV13849.1 hypothetical protein [Rhizobium tropici]
MAMKSSYTTPWDTISCAVSIDIKIQQIGVSRYDDGKGYAHSYRAKNSPMFGVFTVSENAKR